MSTTGPHTRLWRRSSESPRPAGSREREQVSVHNSADQLGRRVTKQPLQMHTTQVVPSGRGRGRARDEHH